MTKATGLTLALLSLGTAACSGGGGGGGSNEGDFGQYEIATDADCEGIAGLSGMLALNAMNEHYETELGYITADAQRVDLTALTIDLALPAEPIAMCYPEFTTDLGQIVGPRVAVPGVEMTFVTADGKFDESLDTKLWTTTNAGFPQAPIALAITTRGALDGDWEPFEDYTPASSNMSFFTMLTGSSSTLTSGNVGAGFASRKEQNAAIFGSGFAMATW